MRCVRDACNSYYGTVFHLVKKAVYEDCLVGMESVLGFIENNALRSVDNVFCNFIASVSREAVHEDSVLVSYAHELGVDLIVLEDLNSLSLFSFLAH